MKRLLVTILIGVAVLGLQPLVVSADSYQIFGPQPFDDDYLFWGNEDYPKSESNGLTLHIQESSISFQSIIGSVTLDYVPNSTLIDERQITRFYVIANGRVVDHFDAAWDGDIDKWRTYYPLRIALEDWNIGSLINLQVVAVSHKEQSPINPDYQNQYVVAWSNTKGPYQLKPLPVIDRDAITVLEAILAKLESLKSMMESKLSQIDASIKKIYEVPPETQAKFDNALANLQSKLPTEQIKNQANDIANVVKDSADRVAKTPQKVKFGEINWMGVITTPAVDFTDMMDYIEKIRNVLKIILWCEFFYFVILILRPKLTV